jgi:hypothetical protein
MRQIWQHVIAFVLRYSDRARPKLTGAEAHLASFTARRVAERYIQVFQLLIT